MLLGAAMGCGEERAPFCSHIHSIGSHFYCYLLCIFVERDSLFGKVRIYIYIFFQLLLLYNFILFFLQLINNKYILGSLCGGVLLVGGLYCVIWGKNREAENKEKAAHTTTTTTHHIAIANIPIAKAEVQTITSVV